MLDSANDNVYTKKWNRLPIYHRLQKLRQYMDEKYKDNEKRQDIESKLTKMINDGELKSCKQIQYDSEICKIIKIVL